MSHASADDVLIQYVHGLLGRLERAREHCTSARALFDNAYPKNAALRLTRLERELADSLSDARVMLDYIDGRALAGDGTNSPSPVSGYPTTNLSTVRPPD
jgi:hypothetical protein